MAADYEVTLSLTDSESFSFPFLLVDGNGDPAPIAGRAFEYALNGCEGLLLDESSGISVDPDTRIITIALAPDKRLSAGEYTHGLRSTGEDGQTVQHFDGAVSVSKGGF